MEEINIRIVDSILVFYDAHSENIKFVNNFITGKAIFNDKSGTQDFIWYVPNLKHAETIDFILSFLISNKLHNGDKITITLDNLVSEVINLNITADDVKNAINEIQNIKIFMVDEGKETDYFFIHF